MDKTLEGQLAAPDWAIPLFARDLIWVEGGTGNGVWAKGERGLFTLETAFPWVILRWGGAEGPALAWLPWQEDTLGWDGAVETGGYLDSMHLAEIPDLDLPIVVFSITGQPLKHGWSPYPNAGVRAEVPYSMPGFFTGLAVDVLATTTTWLVPAQNSLAAIAQAGLVNNLRLYFFGRLADDTGGWAKHFALPILLEAVTLFAP